MITSIGFGWMALVLLAIYFPFGWYVYRMDRQASLNRVFFWLCMSVSEAMVAAFFVFTRAEIANTNWQFLLFAGLVVLPGLILHFQLLLSHHHRLLDEGWTCVILYFPAVYFAYQAFWVLYVNGDPLLDGVTWFWNFVGYAALYPAIGAIIVWRWGKCSTSNREKKQAWVVALTSMLITVLLIITCLLTLFSGLVSLVFSSVFLILLSLLVGIRYGITKYRLMVMSTAIASDEIISRIMELVVLVDPVGTIVRVNRRTEELLHYSEGELLGKPWSSIVLEFEKLTEAMQVLQQNSDSATRLALTYQTKNQEPIPVSICGSTIYDDEGEIIGSVIIAQDMRQTRLLEREIAERRVVEAALLDSNEKLKEIDRLKTDFLSTVSHELRTPLTSILGFAKINAKNLSTRLLPLIPEEDAKAHTIVDQVVQNTRIIVSESERLTALINDVLDIAKMEAGRVEWRMSPVTISTVIDQAVTATNSLLEQKDLTFRKTMQPDLPMTLGDSDRLVQVMINLLSNAVKFTEAGDVTCTAERVNDDIMVSISDTGIGIAEEDLDNIFDKFKQVGDTLTSKPQGTGLGLPICRQIIQHHNGRIWAESGAEKGSVFRFTLPIILAEPTDPIDAVAVLVKQLREHVISAVPTPSEHTTTILVVDDEEHFRQLLRQELEFVGYRVLEAGRGMEAITLAKSEHPDLILLDVMMPEMTGFDVAAVLKNDPATREVPIIILSIVSDQERGYRLGVERYLTKPINTEALLENIQSVLSTSSLRRHVLVVDEDRTTAKVLADYLQSRGYIVGEAYDGSDCIEKAVATRPDMIVLSEMVARQYDIVKVLRMEKGLENVLFVLVGNEGSTGENNAAGETTLKTQ